MSARFRDEPPWAITVLKAVSSPVGRWARIIPGAVLSGGLALALIPVGVLMLVTGALNLCAAGLFLRRPVNGEKLILTFGRVDAVRLGR